MNKSPIALYDRLSTSFLRYATGILVYTLASSAYANPVLDHISAGQVSIQHAPNSTVINQSTQKAIMNWHSFNIGAQEHTHFNQPAGGVTLNRINPSQGVSQIYGRLTSTGQIILVNPAGIYFGPGSYVNVGGLIATTGSITDQNFFDGNYQFTDSSAGAIINQGQIIAAKHGLIALIGGAVSNEGYIEAHVGKVVLASGDAFTMSFSGNQLISFAVAAGVSKRASDKEGHVLASGVSNTGSIIANGGQILISAKDAANVLDNAINMRGIAQARTISDGEHTHDGEIIIYGDKDRGTVSIAGKLDASGIRGGNITITGRNIILNNKALINASGDFGGGRIHIGGNYQGQGPLPTSKSVIMSEGTEINADANLNGHGGNVIIWSDYYTNANGIISAKGGSDSGNGGFIETSSKQLLNVGDLQVNTSAANGNLGMWLLDPYNVSINDLAPEAGIAYNGLTDTWEPFADDAVLNASSLIGSLNTTHVTVTTASGGSEAGNIEVLTDVIWNSANTLTLIADNNISMNANVYSSAGGGLVLNATGNLNFGTDNQARRFDLLSVSSANNRAILGDQTTINLLGNVSFGSLETTNLTSTSIINLGSNILSVGGNNTNTQTDTTLASSTGGSLVKTGSGILTLTGNNTYNGGTSITAGTLSVGHNSALGTNTLTINNGGTLQSAVTGITIGNTINVSGTANIVNNFAFTLSGNIDGAGNLSSSGSGTTTFNGNIGASTALTSFSSFNNMLFNGTTIRTNANQYYDTGLTLSASTTFTSNGGSLLFDSGLNAATPNNIFVTGNAATSITLNGTETGTAALPFNYLFLNASTINFNSDVYSVDVFGIASTININTALINASQGYIGATTLGFAGDVTLTTATGNIGFNGSITGNGNNLILNNGGSGNVSGTLSNLNLVKGGTGRIILSANNSYGTTTINGGILQIGNNGTTGTLGTGNVINNGTLSFARATFPITIGNVISGTGSLRHQGDNTVTLTALNSYSGTTTVDGGGVLSISSIGDAGTDTSIGNSSAAINIGAGTLLYTGTGHSSARPIVITADNANLEASGSGTLTLSGGISGGAFFSDIFTLRGSGNAIQNGVISIINRLSKNGGGTWVLGGNNTYTRDTIINGGTLTLNHANALGTNGFIYVITGATLNLNFVGTLANTTQITLAGTGVSGLGALRATQNSIVSNSILLSSSTTIGADGGTLALTNTGIMSGSGFHLTLTGASSGSIAAALSLGSGSVTSTSTADWLLSGSNFYSGGTNILSGSLTTANNFNAFGSGPIFLGNGSGGSANASVYIQPGVTVSNPIVLSSNTTGTLTVGYNNADSMSSVLTGVSTFTGGITGNNNLTLYNGINSISGGTSLTISGSSINNNGTVTYTGPSPLNTIMSANIGSNVTTLTVNNTGAAALVLSGTNTHGNTVISSGSLHIGNGGVTGSINANNITNNGNLTINRSNNFTLSNLITGSGSFTKLGNNTLILTGNNTYTGLTTISAGTLQIGNGGATGAIAGAILNNATLTFNTTNSFSINNVISGSGNINKLGSGILTLGGNNTFSGLLTISNGGVTVNHPNGLGSTTGATNLNSGELLINSVTVGNEPLFVNGGNLSSSGTGGFGGNILAFTPFIFTNNGDSFTLGGLIDGSSSLTLRGAGTTTLNGALGSITAPTSLTIESNINVAGGSIRTNGGFQTYTGTVNLINDTTFELSNSGAILFNNPITGGKNITLNGSSIGFYGFTINSIEANNVTVMTAAGSTGSLLDLNSGGPQTFNMTAMNSGNVTEIATVTGAFTFDNIQSLRGGINSTSTLRGMNTPNTWNILSTDYGIMSNLSGTFNNFQNLTGGSDTDYFTFDDFATISGTVDGGDTVGDRNHLDFAAYVDTLTLNLSMPTGIEFNTGEVRDVSSALIANFIRINGAYGNGPAGNGISTIVLPNSPGIKIAADPLNPDSDYYGYIADPFYYSNWIISNPPIPPTPPTPSAPPIPSPGGISLNVASILNQPIVFQDSEEYYSTGSGYSLINRTSTNPLLKTNSVQSGNVCYSTYRSK